MKPIPFIGGLYEASSTPADSQRAVNLLVEVDQAGGEPQVMYGVGKLALLYTLATSPVRGAVVMNGRTFMVGGNTLYETTSGVPVALGTLSTSTGKVGMTNNDTTLLIVDGVAGYTFNGAFAVIDDPDFPNGVTQCAWEGQYFIVGVDGSKQFFISEVGITTWNGLDFASAENKPEILRSLIVLHDRLVLFTTTGAEQWNNTGGGEFAFERDNGSSIEVGIEAPNSLVTMNNGLFWLGQDRDGGGMVFQLQGGVPGRVSDHGLEQLLQGTTRSDAYAFACQQNGHTCYALTVPSLERTFVYDAAAPQNYRWSERGHWLSTQAKYARYQPFCHVYNGQHLFGDWQSGNVYGLDTKAPSDRWVRRTAPLKSKQDRISISMMELDMEVGISPTNEDSQVMFRASTDGGKTWRSERFISIGREGMTRQRVRIPRLGMGRNWVFEFSGTDNYRPALFGLYIE